VTDDRTPQPDDENLEDQREFLLRSLDDLDNELLAGNIDPDTYRVLHDDYTARASKVIQTIEDGVKRKAPSPPQVSMVTRVVTIGAIVTFAVLAAILLANTVGQRRAGQQITGNAKGTPTTVAADDVTAAKAAVTAAPKSYDARIRYARALYLSVLYPAALDEYIMAAKLDASQPEPLAYTGWLTALFAREEPDAATRLQLFDAATSSLDRAISVDPTYPDSYVFKGLMLSQLQNQPCLGAAAFQQFLVIAPEKHPLRPQVLAALADAVKTGKCPALPTTPTTKP
jgi:tetratricopeptide (TPR) repeat protein